MAKRSPATDPIPNDVLLFAGWRVEVLSVLNGEVEYRKSKDGSSQVRTQTLQEWIGWAKDAKVKRRGIASDECVVLERCWSGKCADCGVWIDANAHAIGLRVTCATCCKGSHKKGRAA